MKTKATDYIIIIALALFGVAISLSIPQGWQYLWGYFIGAAQFSYIGWMRLRERNKAVREGLKEIKDVFKTIRDEQTNS